MLNNAYKYKFIIVHKAKQVMKQKHIESNLQQLEGFSNPNYKFEQYATTPHIAASMLFSVQSNHEDITGRRVADLGCGCGVLTIGCVMLDAKHVDGYDVDEMALDICRQNLEDCDITEGEDVTLTHQNILEVEPGDPDWWNCVDTVIMNPPFGTKNNEGIDLHFVRVGLSMAQTAVYSLHKTSTREGIRRKVTEWGAEMTVEAELRFNLDKSYKFHKEKSVDIEVDFIRFYFKDDKKSFEDKLKRDTGES